MIFNGSNEKKSKGKIIQIFRVNLNGKNNKQILCFSY